jgi:hypothetical protein
MANVAVIGCAPSDILSACQNTITSLAVGGHTVYAVIARSEESESASSSSPSPEIADISQLAAIGITHTFPIDRFDYSAITQANADGVNSHIKNVKPSLVIMPSWKSPNHKRKILARTSLIACRGIGTILMYELDANNISFNPNIIFEVPIEHSVIQHRTNNTAETTTTADQHEINNIKTFTNSSILEDKRYKTRSYERLEEKFESHRTLLLEEEELF